MPDQTKNLLTNTGKKIFTDIGKKMYDAVLSVDTAMTHLCQVTDETEEKYTQFLSSATNSAHNLGISITNLIEQTANWSKLGYSLDEAAKLAEISSLYANVSQVDNDTAVRDIAAAMKAFNIEAADSISIIDKLHQLGKDSAATAADLGAGLSRSASSMAAAGTDINKTLAMLAGGATITQNAADFGDFLNIGSLRIRGMKDELAALGEEVDASADSISKVQAQILNHTGGNVNIFDDTDHLRNYYDIMEDISKVYHDLNNSDQTALTDLLFGKKWEAQAAAFLQTFQSGQIQEALESALHADGSAMEAQEQQLASLTAKVQQFETAFQSLSSSMLDSDLLKWFVDLGTSGVQALAAITDQIGALGTVGLGAGLMAGAKNTGKRRISVRTS